MASVTRKKHSGRASTRTPVKAKLIDATERLLDLGESYTELSVERLISEADISRSTFYVHFADKGDLLKAITQDIATQLTADMTMCWQLPARASQHDLRQALGELAQTYRPHANLLAAVVETAGYDPAVREQWALLMDTTISSTAAQLQQGQSLGYVCSDVHPLRTAQWLIWMIERGYYQLVRQADDEAVEELVSELTAIIWSRVYQPCAPTPDQSAHQTSSGDSSDPGLRPSRLPPA